MTLHHLLEESREEFEKKYSFLLNPDEPESFVRKEFGRDIESLIKKAYTQALYDAEKAGIIFGVREGDAFKQMSLEELRQSITSDEKKV